jgi:hypothetical protein
LITEKPKKKKQLSEMIKLIKGENKIDFVQVCIFYNYMSYTVKLILRGHLQNKEKKWPYKTGDLLKDGQSI